MSDGLFWTIVLGVGPLMLAASHVANVLLAAEERRLFPGSAPARERVPAEQRIVEVVCAAVVPLRYEITLECGHRFKLEGEDAGRFRVDRCAGTEARSVRCGICARGGGA